MRFEEIQKSGLYVAVGFSRQTQNAIANFAKKHKVPNRFSRTKFHSTIIYSKKPCKEYIPVENINYKASFGGWDVFPSLNKQKNALVMLLKSEDLVKRYSQLMKELDASSEYDEFKPHITLSYDIGNYDVKQLPKFEYNIEIIKEYSEPIKQNINQIWDISNRYKVKERYNY